MDNKEKTFDKKQNIQFQMQPLSFERMNEKLIRVSCNLLGTGPNRNRSNITKEAIEKANEGLAHLPVVGHLYQVENEDTGEMEWRLGGHDSQIIENGYDWEIKSICTPLGCIAGDTPFEFVELVEDAATGETREYLRVDMILWNHISPLFETAYNKKLYFNNSVELSDVDGSWGQDGSFKITSFSYDCTCLLGLGDNWGDPRHVEPCFKNSQVFPKTYAQNDFKSQFSLLLEEIKKFNDEQKSVTEESVVTTVTEVETEIVKAEVQTTETKEVTASSDLDIYNQKKQETQELQSKKNNVKEGDSEVKKEYSFFDISERVKASLAEKKYMTKFGKEYQKYEVLWVKEDNTVGVVDREDKYTAYIIPFIFTSTDEGIIVNFDFENKIVKHLGLIDSKEESFDVVQNITTYAQDYSDYNVSVHSNERINDLMAKLDTATANYQAAVERVVLLEKQLSIFETEKKQYAAEKHKSTIDAIIAAKREDMSRYSEFLEWELQDHYGKTAEQVMAELKDIHYNFLNSQKEKNENKYSFSAIETNVAPTSDKSAFAERYGEEVARILESLK